MFKFSGYSPVVADRLGVTARVLVAALAGYVLAMVACLWLGQGLSLNKQEARTLNNMMFFVFYACVIIWVFSPQSHFKAVLSTLGVTGLAWAAWWAIAPQGVAS
ncbi:hypothetical protein [Halioxenophilus aromaticivorans]